MNANQVSKAYGSFLALNAVDLNVRRGDILGLVGDNGAGKSTLLKLLTGLIFASSGEISLFGSCSKKAISQQFKRTGTMIEQPGFFPQLSIEKNLEYYRILKGAPGKESVAKVLETVNLSSAKNKKARALSMGMKQRLGLAIARHLAKGMNARLEATLARRDDGQTISIILSLQNHLHTS